MSWERWSHTLWVNSNRSASIQATTFAAVVRQCRQKLHEFRIVTPPFLSALGTQLDELSAKALRREGEVLFGRPEISQAHIDRQRRQHTVQVRAVFNPC